MAKTFDPRCYELAEHFLSDHPHLNSEAARITLAQQIQQTIEDELEFMETVEGKVA